MPAQTLLLAADLPRIKAKMDEVKRGLADIRVEAESGGGAVRVRRVSRGLVGRRRPVRWLASTCCG